MRPSDKGLLPPDAEARHLADELMEAKHGALGTLLNRAPFVTRVALARNGGAFLTLVSDLAPHTEALRRTPQASLLLGEPPAKGDPLAFPRLTLQVDATFLEKTETSKAQYLASQPKAQLYIGFADFHLVRLTPSEAHLNGGFGKAYRFTSGDLKG